MTRLTSLPPRDRDGDDRSERNRAFTSVLHVNEKGGSFGGTEEYIALVATALHTRRITSHLACGVVTGTLPADLASVSVVAGLESRRPRPGTARALAALIGELDPDLIYLHNIFDPAVVSAVAAIEGRATLLWYVHDHYLTCLSELRWRRDIGSCPQRLGHDCLSAIGDGHCVLRDPTRTYAGDDVERRAALSRSLAEVDAVVVVSDYMRALLRQAEPALESRVHLLCRPIREVRTRRARQRTRPDEQAVVTFAGRITAEKGLDVVIEALGAVPNGAPVELRVAGVIEDDGYWSRCRELAAAARGRRRGLTLTYLGHLDYAATDELFRQSDIVAVPSQWPEPLGAVALEAMAAGAAVIASRIGGLVRTVVHDVNGLHAEPGDVASWASALATLLDDPDRARRLGEQARHDVAGIAIDDHLDDLDRLVAAHRPPDRRRPNARVTRGRTPRDPPVRRDLTH